jgi:SpoVK/Ycf46/Vps4 family AAA+-type ATPase
MNASRVAAAKSKVRRARPAGPSEAPQQTNPLSKRQVKALTSLAQTAEKSPRMRLLFSGPNGAGKTAAAEFLARTLGVALYRIDLREVVGKYVGATEKRLRRLFDRVEASGAILLFDEADALFGKRSQVKDSHDRYANIEVGYLLERLQTFQGLVILTGNRRPTIDTAFMRKKQFRLSFGKARRRAAKRKPRVS